MLILPLEEVIFLEKRKVQIFLMGKNLNKSLEIGIGLQTSVQTPDDVEMETISVQTERDYRLMITQGYGARPSPLAVLVDAYIVTDNGDRTYPDTWIMNLKRELGYSGPIIACAEQPVLNDHLIEVGATHRIGEPAPEKSLGTPVSVQDVIKQTAEIISGIVM